MPKQGLFGGWVHTAADRLERFGERVPAYAFVLVIAFLLVLAVACSRGGHVQPEIEQYIPHYLSHRPLLSKIYDYKKVEIWSAYRPRPLSYMVDDFDVAFIAWSARHGFPHLLSASKLVFWALDCLLLWFYFCHRLGLHRFTAGLLICLFSTDRVVFHGTGYFRSAKPRGGIFSVECVRGLFRMCSGGAQQALKTALYTACLFRSSAPARCLPFR